MVTREAVEKLVAERLEQLESGRVAGDAKSRALSLKLRQPSQRQEEPAKEEVQQMRQELVAELKDMKEQLRVANAMNTQLLQELRSQNLALLRQPSAPPKVEVEEAKEPPKEAPKEAPKDYRVELSEEQRGELAAILGELVAAYETAKEQTELLKRLKIPIQSGVKTPSARKVDINSGMFKGVFDKRPEAVAKFFLAAGFTSTTPTKYEFLRPAPSFEEGEAANPFTGNVEVLETLTKLIEAELAKLPQ